MELTWKDAEEIAFQLAEMYHDTDLHRMVTELSDFQNDLRKSNEGILEAIQMVWYEEYQS